MVFFLIRWGKLPAFVFFRTLVDHNITVAVWGICFYRNVSSHFEQIEGWIETTHTGPRVMDFGFHFSGLF